MLTLSNRRIIELREENATLIAERKKEAEDAVALLREHVMKRLEVERANSGLIILEATYGVLDTPSAEGDERTMDVTIALQSLVNSGQLIIPAGPSKSNLLGFYDCAISEKKVLRVKYQFKTSIHQFTVGDLDAVAAPLRSHVVVVQ